jgi:hypothetical protein
LATLPRGRSERVVSNCATCNTLSLRKRRIF